MAAECTDREGTPQRAVERRRVINHREVKCGKCFPPPPHLEMIASSVMSTALGQADVSSWPRSVSFILVLSQSVVYMPCCLPWPGQPLHRSSHSSSHPSLPLLPCLYRTHTDPQDDLQRRTWRWGSSDVDACEIPIVYLRPFIICSGTLT